MRATIEARMLKVERRLFSRTRGVHRYSDAELAGLIAWLKDPRPADEQWAAALLRREGLMS
jgi:hypothetical protein